MFWAPGFIGLGRSSNLRTGLSGRRLACWRRVSQAKGDPQSHEELNDETRRWITPEVLEYAHDLYYPRFERYFNNTVVEEQLILNYDHDDFHGDAELDKEIQRVEMKATPNRLIERLYTVDSHRIPTYPGGKVTTMLLEDRSYIEIERLNRDLPRFRRGNFLDPSYLGGGHLVVRNEMPLPKMEHIPKLPRILRDLPRIEHIFLVMPFHEDQGQDQLRCTRAKSLLYLISGVNVAEFTYKDRANSETLDCQGKTTGARTIIAGPEAYSFLDKTVNIVMPNIFEWDGLAPFPGPVPGSLCFMIPAMYTIFYPDIYSIRSSFSELFDLHVIIKTTTQSANSAATLLSAFQFPFINNIRYSHISEIPSSVTNPKVFPGSYLHEPEVTPITYTPKPPVRRKNKSKKKK